MDAALNASAVDVALIGVVNAATLATVTPAPPAPVALDSLASLHAFYMSSHTEAVNYAIHAAAVPVLKVSILLLLAALTARPVTTRGAAAPARRRFGTLLAVDAGLVASAAFVAYYAALEPAVGVFAAALFGAEWLTARGVLAAAGGRRGVAVAVGVAGIAATQVAMVVGHHVWEGAPQAIVAGPAAAVAAAPLCMQLDVVVAAGWLPRVAAVLAGGV